MRHPFLPFLLEPESVLVMACGGLAITAAYCHGAWLALAITADHVARSLSAALGETLEDYLKSRRDQWDAAIKASVERGINSARERKEKSWPRTPSK